MKKVVLLSFLLVLGVAGCVNVARERREQLWRDTKATKPAEMPARRAQLKALLLGADKPRDPDPHVRATSAQLLGEIGEPDDIDSLFAALKGLYADESVMVRMECAVAIGKLHFPAITDRRRKFAISELLSRLAYERDVSGRIEETDYQVRNAMINSLAALGNRDAASALLDVARRIRADLANLETLVFAGGGEEGLFDQCVDSLVQLTGVPRDKARKDRASHDNIEDHLKWWADRIAEMPQVPLG
jgi:HEAT repeat protein